MLQFEQSLQVENITHIYTSPGKESTTALVNITLSFPRTDRWTIIGPSGCGKTSLLLLLAGLLFPSSGRIHFNNRIIRSPQPEISLLLQDYGLFPWKTVLDNALFGLALKRTIKLADINRVLAILELLGIREQQHKHTHELSGGQRQRVALARTLALEPKYLLMDEPFSALDALTREQLQDLLLNLWKIFHFTIIFVTHNIEEAVFMGNNIIILSPAPGRVAHTITNISPGGLARNSAEFHERCTEVRSLLEGSGKI